ncbi:thiosulfate sulfurtransferase 16 chloroplastic isoform X1 [Prunus yedoensis var. nudiflora]|uniref:Thiosulfate sulfurtransferase 16 chloroplastic isoform X1 n=1 Tax=Prunus yedoensis var. nudiflora TaxID=2094558 RepID=A0A314Z8K7_PRUYE|nr:thiosulfate sulfurtransferase 16 chloroplastic isoform X1 [Prunus yedoensis var. nudiflora]
MVAISLVSSSSCLTGSALQPPSLFSPQNLNQRSLLSLNVNLQRHGTGIQNKNCSFCPRAAQKGNLEAVGVPTSVPVRVAHELLQAGHKYLDVRTPDEFSRGRAPGAVNIPYLYKIGSGMSKNPEFLKEVASHFRKHDEIIVGCQLGKRSMMAATDLLAAGFTGITDIAGGYAAWTQTGLPTEK